MGVTARVSEDKKTVTVSVEGRFDFSMHNAFRKAYKDVAGTGFLYLIDLKGAEYMDSSALGMLLMLKEHAESNASKIKITHISNDIREILTIASFDKLFVLE
jgi:HptB-dependent secretion and biofilm anti anti-sigma factor